MDAALRSLGIAHTYVLRDVTAAVSEYKVLPTMGCYVTIIARLRASARIMDTYLFLDTEWADDEGRELVSLALVSHDEASIFYAERSPLPTRTTEFVSNCVYPLLEGGSAALGEMEFTRELRVFLCAVPTPHVVYDYLNDGALLLRAISGFGRLPSELADMPPPPRHLKSSLLTDAHLSPALEEYFLAHPDEASKRHHALVDAQGAPRRVAGHSEPEIRSSVQQTR